MSLANFMRGMPRGGYRFNVSGNIPNVRSRAYAKFKSVDALVTFHKAFNNHTFTDSKGDCNFYCD